MGVFQCGVFQPNVFQTCGGGDSGGVGGSLAWIKRYGEKDAEDRRKADLLALIRSSDEYKRLQRKLRMLHEHLLDDPRSWKIKDGIAAIEAQIEMMERL
jgi:hypothetical protein